MALPGPQTYMRLSKVGKTYLYVSPGLGDNDGLYPPPFFRFFNPANDFADFPDHIKTISKAENRCPRPFPVLFGQNKAAARSIRQRLYFYFVQMLSAPRVMSLPFSRLKSWMPSPVKDTRTF